MVFVATCLFGLEGFLNEEIDSLGYRRIENMDGRAIFEGDALAAARVQVFSRYAERLYWLAGRFACRSFDELFEGTKKTEFEVMFGERDAFPVSGHCVKSDLYSVTDCQRIIKKAIATRLGFIYGMNRCPEDGTVKPIEFFLFKNTAYLMVELSGDPLHKRGYRLQTVEAPLRETLAAAVVRFSRPRENVVTWDPFCGSGTIAVEAAMMMTNRAPGRNRYFRAEEFPLFPGECWKQAREEADDLVDRSSTFTAFASDIDENCVSVAAECAKRAGVSDIVKVFRLDALKIQKPEGIRGTIVSNPPYGERLLDHRRAEQLYRDMGKAFAVLSGYKMYFLSSHENFPNLFGRRADKIRKMVNGSIPCYLYQYYKDGK